MVHTDGAGPAPPAMAAAQRLAYDEVGRADIKVQGGMMRGW